MSNSLLASEPALAVSVIIPVRNAADTIARQLTAVCEQDIGEPFEVIVVDNGSTDSTADVVRRAATRFPNLRLVGGPESPNRSAARNAGARAARSSALAFCDADDLVDRGWLRALLDALRRADVVTGALIRVSAGDNRQGTQSEPFASRFRGLSCIAAGNFAIGRRLYLDLGGFSEVVRHRVDTELSCRLYVRGIRVVYAPAARVLYAKRATPARELRQHFLWAMAGVQIQRAYRSDVPFSYGWKNSIKHWLLVGPALLRAALRRGDLHPPALTLATLAGQLVGSIRYRIWAI